MKHRISSSRMPHCPRLYQFENMQGHREDNSSELATMGEVGHTILSKNVDFCSRKNIMRSEGYFNHLVAKHSRDCPQYLREDLLEVLERFQWTWNLNLSAVAHITEIEMGVNEQLEPCDVEDDVDRLTGRPDYIEVHRDHSVHIYDWKLGYRQFEMDEAYNNVQLAIYAFLWFIHHPECQKVTVTVWGVRWGFNNRSSHDWTRELLAESDINPAEMFKSALLLARHYEDKFGEKDWPHAVNHNWCKWCHPMLVCPEVTNADGYLREVLHG